MLRSMPDRRDIPDLPGERLVPRRGWRGRFLRERELVFTGDSGQEYVWIPPGESPVPPDEVMTLPDGSQWRRRP